MSDFSFDLKLLRELTGKPGVSGREQSVIKLIQENLPPEFEIETDVLGNLTAHLPGNGKKLMYLAHADEVGLMVQRIMPNGFLSVERIGGISIPALPGARMDLWTETSHIPAQVGILPGHLDSDAQIKLNDCFIDIGANTDKEAVEMGVQTGDVLTWSHNFQQLNKHIISSKALDDRLGCFALLVIARTIAKQTIPVDLTFAFSVQEENMLSGNLPIIHKVQPDIVIGIDGTLVFDTPDLFGKQSDIRLGKGPVLKWMDAIHGKLTVYVPDLKLSQRIRKIAQEHNVPFQQEVMTGLSTALTPVPYQGLGIRTSALSLPIRYHHSPIESAHLNDLIALINLLDRFIQSCNLQE